MPTFTCDLSEDGRAFVHFWEHTVGSGHAPLALRADWQAQFEKCTEDCGFKHVRFHGLLSGTMQTLFIHEDEPRYSFYNVDRIYDFLLDIGVRPFVELSFMPEALASGEETVFNYVNHVSPPQDYAAWGDLIHAFVTHCVSRYGAEEVRRWYFEVWNEPNLDAFWSGSQGDYFELYRVTAQHIKAVDEQIRVGGPSSAQNEWIPDFLDFCQEHDLPADFVTTHHYPTDAFGDPSDDTETQLAKSERSVLRRQAQEAKGKTRGKPLYYTEWNSSSNPRDTRHDLPYTAAFVIKTIMEAQGIVDGYSFWTFSDIFEENYMPSLPYHGGFGMLNLYGVPKPVYRAYQLLHRLGDEQLAVQGEHETVDVWAVGHGGRIDVIVTNHALPRRPLAQETVRLQLKNAPRPATIKVARIDEHHANPYRFWQEMGSPQYLSETQVADLKIVSQLHWEAVAGERTGDGLQIELALPPQGVAAVTVFPPDVEAIDLR